MSQFNHFQSLSFDFRAI